MQIEQPEGQQAATEQPNQNQLAETTPVEEESKQEVGTGTGAESAPAQKAKKKNKKQKAKKGANEVPDIATMM